jgi:transposase
LQVTRHLEQEYLFYDTTSISSYSKSLKRVKYGYNKEQDPLPQINLALVMGERSRLPVYYRSLPGNISDVKTLKELLSSLGFLKLPGQVKLVMDRGFYSQENIQACYHQHLKFLIAGKTSLKLTKEVLARKCKTMITRSHYHPEQELYMDTQLLSWDFTEIKPRSGETVEVSKRLYLHLYFNDQRAVDDRQSFHRMLDGLEQELRNGVRVPEHETAYARYFEVNETPKRGIQLRYRQEAITAKEQDYGYFVLLSNDIKDPVEALEIYRAKDTVEKAFGNLKERLNLRRTSVSSEENLEGKLFVQFIALTLLSYLQKAMRDKDQFKYYTLQEALDELDVIECIEQPGKRRRISEMTQKQLDLYEVFGVTPPTSLV